MVESRGTNLAEIEYNSHQVFFQFVYNPMKIRTLD